MTDKVFDIAIVGGGLAGLCLAIQAAQQNYSVVLFEKEKYPYHKVCGEYISMESWDFLERMGVPLRQLNLPKISQLKVTAPNGNVLAQPLALGGFGISRFLLDDTLSKIAKAKGVELIEEIKVEDIQYTDCFVIQTTKGSFTSKVCCGSYGKKSNLDVKWKRSFLYNQQKKEANYIGIKYHAKVSVPNNEIALHNFKDGYCGISKIENDMCCICYLTTAKNLKQCNGDIAAMEKQILSQNKHLANIFATSQIVYDKPQVISQVNFSIKTCIENHVLLLGDAAGLIAPLCGNGMSMAMHSSKIAFEQINLFLQNKITQSQLESNYTTIWKQTFAKRLWFGRNIQNLFGIKFTTNLFIGILKKLPWLAQWLIKNTHGKPF
jgi:menaquinone-9 beta-reductase